MTSLSIVTHDTGRLTREEEAVVLLEVAVQDVVRRLRGLSHTTPAYRVARVAGLLEQAGRSAESLLADGGAR